MAQTRDDDAHETWAARLDELGPLATRDELVAHLSHAVPDDPLADELRSILARSHGRPTSRPLIGQGHDEATDSAAARTAE